MHNRFIPLVAAAVLTVSCFHVNPNYKSGKKAVTIHGEVASRVLDLKDFTNILAEGSPDITLHQSDSFRVVVRTHEDLFEWLDYRVENGTLEIRTKEGHPFRMIKEYAVEVSAPAFEIIRVNGASDILMPDGYDREDGQLTFLIKGSGDVKLGRIRCVQFTAQVEGAGDLQVKSLVTKCMSVGVKGAGDVDAGEIDVDGRVDVQVVGAGDVRLAGHAASCSVKVKGAGDADVRHLKVDGEFHTDQYGSGEILRAR